MMNILAISGSLRRASSNTTLLRAVQLLAPDTMTITLYVGLGDLPHFNPDLEGMEAQAVLDFRNQLKASDGVLISSPEYAHGVPGSLKNALDWLVASGELIYKPVALLNPSPRSTYAQASLTEILTVMTATVVEAACVTLPIAGKPLDAAAIAAHPEFAPALQAALTSLADAITTADYGS